MASLLRTWLAIAEPVPAAATRVEAERVTSQLITCFSNSFPSSIRSEPD